MFKYLKDLFTPFEPSEELFDGVPKPSSILAGMIASRLLTDEFKPVGNKARFKGYTVEWTPSDKGDPTRHYDNPRLQEALDAWAEKTNDHKGRWIRGHYQDSFWTNLRKFVNNYLDKCPHCSIKFDDKTVEVVFSETEILKIHSALNRAQELHEGRLEAQRQADNQQKAVTAIENFFKSPTESTT